MKRKRSVFLVFIAVIVLSANFLLIKYPVGDLINLKNLWFGVGLFAASIIICLGNIFAKKTFLKSYICYKPRDIWFIGFLVFVEGLIIVLYSITNTYFPTVSIISEIHINLVIQLLISLGLVVAMFEVYRYMYEYPVRRVLKVMDKAGLLINNSKFNEALDEFEKVQKKFDYSKQPQIYGWIKHAKGVCYIEMSKHEEKKKNLLLAAKEFEEILNFEELQAQHGQVRFDMGNLFYDIAEIDNELKYYENALDMFNDALNQYKQEKNFDGCMNALRNAEKTKTVLILEKTS